MTQNTGVGNNLANGTQGPGHAAHCKKVNGHSAKRAHASETEHVLWEVDKKFVKVCPKCCKTLAAKFPLPECLRLSKKDKAKIFLSAVQIPLISNDAATGHKLQGSSLDAVCIPSWSCSTNWPRAMLSRVGALDGLCLGKPLDPSKDCSVPQSLQRMLRKLRRNKMPAEFDCGQLDLNRT
jgi:hypothetical protein